VSKEQECSNNENKGTTIFEWLWKRHRQSKSTL